MAKSKYKVYSRWEYIQECGAGYPEECEWKTEGETYAVSEAQAINNIRFRNGNSPMWSPVWENNECAAFIEWKAEPV